ncbi:Beta-monoglucosyldiacylglycerol synthase [Methyloligella halotolerans]|uniref:Beta-monoglucosyldiacylglycerol synthase n=1 Tax=Methyloligella halotolerans TaxID=1177755 RepID=A0A1E2RXT3_9HYPH|nr:glycosyltransferase family 2 protein [Methyloligella halotolerans]ODA67056.1 Beta-monoglucosyldiacylglycerol synthase [Methyloligella halotolerans]
MLGGKQIGDARVWPAPDAHPDPFTDYEFLLHGTIDRATLALGVALGARWGVAPHQALISTGRLDAEDYTRALARHCGVGFVEPEQRHRLVPPAPALRPRDCLRTGLLKQRGARVRAVLAGDNRNPADLRRGLAGIDKRFLALAPQPAVRAAICRHFETAFKGHAAEGLHRRDPDRSAKSPLPRWIIGTLTAAAIAIAGSLAVSFTDTIRVLSLLTAALFVPIAGLRIAALWHFATKAGAPIRAVPRIPDAALPVYTLLVPLLREAAVVGRLTDALKRLDYPAAKLDIKLILEETDHETLAAVRALRLPGNFELVVAPDFAPRTKPKALNFAMPLARGDYVVIYDAEDLPEPDQLRKALHGFRVGPPNLACVQAKLNLYNAGQSWLTKQFTLEYTALFDGLLPALSAFGLPIPLGGTSNHFRISALKWLSGWDAYNVTEDADLGIRLARAGYSCGVIDSTTHEEAPPHLRLWVAQRTRWMKGYIQTYLVHMRHPRRTLRELGWRGFLGFQLMVGGTVLSALVHPWFYALAAYDFVRSTLFAAPAGLLGWPIWGLAAFVFLGGYGGALALAAFAARKRRHRLLLPQIALMPAYWLLVSWGTYRGLWHFVTKRFAWEKTPHGLARIMPPSGLRNNGRAPHSPV